MVGGCYYSGGKMCQFTAMERYDPRSGTTNQLREMPTYRKKLSAAAFDNKIFVVGGERYVEAKVKGEAAQSHDYQFLNTVEM